MIITLTGESGLGKTRIARELIEYPHTHMLTSCTTREPRSNDVPGEYNYITPEAFKQEEEQGLYEWIAPPMRGRHYGTPRAALDIAFRDIDQHWIMILVPETLPLLQQAAKQREEKHSWIKSFFILSPPRRIIETRLRDGRNLTDEQIAVDRERCADWEDQVRALKYPMTFIEDDNDFDGKLRRVLEACPFLPPIS